MDFAARVQGGGRRPQELRQLQELEAAAGLLPDPEIDAFMKASDHRVPAETGPDMPMAQAQQRTAFPSPWCMRKCPLLPAMLCRRRLW